MKIKLFFLFLFCLGLFKNYAQNQPSLQKQKLEEFRALFFQNIDLQIGSLCNYKNINFTIDECAIQIGTIDVENTNEEDVKITFPTSGAMLTKNGELNYKTKVIREIIENKTTKLTTINLYKNSKYIGLLLKLENAAEHKKIQDKLKALSRYCKLEKNQ